MRHDEIGAPTTLYSRGAVGSADLTGTAGGAVGSADLTGTAGGAVGSADLTGTAGGAVGSADLTGTAGGAVGSADLTGTAGGAVGSADLTGTAGGAVGSADLTGTAGGAVGSADLTGTAGGAVGSADLTGTAGGAVGSADLTGTAGGAVGSADLTGTAGGAVGSADLTEKNGLQKYEYVLHPRTTGFTFIVESLRKGDNLDAVHDITVAYPQNIPQTERHLVTGQFPREIHFHVQRYPVKALPEGTAELQDWCQERWREKEQRLQDFYTGGHCDNLDAVHDITVAYPQNIPQTERHLVTGQFPREIHFHVQRYPVKALPEGTAELQDWCQERWREKEQRLQDFYTGGHCFDTSGRSRIPPCKSELRVMLIKMASLVYWTGFITLSFAALYYFSLLRYYLLLVTVFFVAQERVVGGLEVLELACHRLRNLPEKAAASETEKSK
ncbi:UNVERIFIED_CONTAM: hypothetical protein FKN15_075911 [Acipenser sinensis]